MSAPQDDDSRKIPLPFSLLGLVAACCIAVWAGIHYMTNNASLFYGLLAGLSFGATFAFGQQIKHRFVPPKKRKTDWKVQAPGAAELSQAKLAAHASRKICVEFDEHEIRTTVQGAKREGIAWSDIDDVTIRIRDGNLPRPEWIIAGKSGGDVKGVLVPNDAEGLDQLQGAMKDQLPGFDNGQTYSTVIAAMAAMEGSFHVWSRKSA